MTRSCVVFVRFSCAASLLTLVELGNVNINVIDEEVVVKPEAIIEPKDQEL
jgi:hypothetical protein